jgi:hypothetical protein
MGVDIVEYLLKTGPISLGDLLTRLPDPSGILKNLKELEERGDIDIKGKPGVLRDLTQVAEQTQQTSGDPESARDQFFDRFKDIPEASEIRVFLSESGFRKMRLAR